MAERQNNWVNGKLVPFTDEEQEEWEAHQATRSARPEAILAEGTRRINEQASPAKRERMVALMAAGLVEEADRPAYLVSLNWTASIKAAAKSLIEAQDPDYLNDDKWPAPPAEAVAFVVKYGG